MSKRQRIGMPKELLALGDYAARSLARRAISRGTQTVYARTTRRRGRSPRSFVGKSMGAPSMYTAGPGPARRVKSSRFDVVSKMDVHGSLVSSEGGSPNIETLYMVIATHAPRYVYRIMCMSVLRLAYKRWGIDLSRANQPGIEVSNVDELVIVTALQLRKNESGVSFTTVIAADTVFVQQADDWASAIIANCTQYANSAKMTSVTMWLRQTGSANQSTQRVQFDMTSMKVAVKADTYVHIQNRTVGGDASVDNDSIFANPLHGKVFYCNGLNPEIRAFASGIGKNEFNVDTTTGIKATTSSASVFDTTYQDMLRDIPHGHLWRNCRYEAGIRFQPGEIRQVKISSNVVKSWNSWMNLLLPWFMSGDTGSGGVQAVGGSATGSLQVYNDFRAGKSAVIALQKVCNLQVSPPSIGYEKKTTYQGKAFYRPRRFVAATNNEFVPNTLPI